MAIEMVGYMYSCAGVYMLVHLEGTGITAHNHIRLHDQMYHYLYSGAATY